VGVLLFGFGVGVLFGFPALFDSGKAPAHAVDGTSDRLVVDDDVDRIRMAVREDSDGRPAALLEPTIKLNHVTVGIALE
jgi:hypothetical protein